VLLSGVFRKGHGGQERGRRENSEGTAQGSNSVYPPWAWGSSEPLSIPPGPVTPLPASTYSALINKRWNGNTSE